MSSAELESFSLKDTQIRPENIDEIMTLSRSKIDKSHTTKTTTEKSSTSETDIASDALEPDAILCLLWHRNILGGAYYKTTDKQLYILNDFSDSEPDFLVTKSVVREVNPRYVLTIGNTVQPFIRCLITCLTDEGATIDSDNPISVPSNMSLLPYKEYLEHACVYKIWEINLPSAPTTREEKQMFLNSLINFANQRSTYALGVLLKFMEQYWANFCPDDRELTFLHINQISLANNVLMDKNVFKALQIFQASSHKASFIHGSCDSTNYEGTSLFKLFSMHIKSNIGLEELRIILANPVNDVSELNKRLDFIDFALASRNQGLMDTLRNLLKKLNNLQYIFSKIHRMLAKKHNWYSLYQTIITILHINELCVPYRHSSSILLELNSKITSNLYGLEKSISLALDFKDSIKTHRPVIKFGLDSQLDAKRLKLQNIAKSVTTAANFAVDHLPSYIDSCMVVHVPEMGYLVAIKEWENNSNKDQLAEFGFQFAFQLGGFLHYKNAMCKELDKLTGNLYDDIRAHENRIINRLRGFVLKYNNDIRVPLKIIALMDCLQSLAKVAKQNNYVRPSLNSNNTHEIEESWHPLLNNFSNTFVPNDYRSYENSGRIKIITGPNASGKSVYLKQIAIIIYLAHIGSFLPAKKASIGMLYSIQCRLHTTESASVRMSSFMIDMREMSRTLYISKVNTLIIMDEFGRGTTESEGEALHAAVLRGFVKNGMCPHILVATHFQRLSAMLEESLLINHMKMNYMIEDKRLVFLYKLSEGTATSFALDVAESHELMEDVLQRAKEVFDALQNNKTIKPISRNIPGYNNLKINDMKTFLEDVYIPHLN